jgi:polyisoprenyl-phosphate glycosyltransferase
MLLGGRGGAVSLPPQISPFELHVFPWCWTISLMQIVVMMPVFEDWDTAIKVCERIDKLCQTQPDIHARIMMVNDGSTTRFEAPKDIHLAAIDGISILELKRNLGHQRAIAVGLAYLQHNYKADALVVMDADGEDRPEDIAVLLEELKRNGNRKAVFAERGKRMESFVFRTLYQVYRGLHRMLTGRDIRFGNFSVLPWADLESLVVFPELWNHYAATFIKSRLPYTRVRCPRGTRIGGESRMGFVGLVVHGLSALFSNQEIVGTRLLILNLLLAAAIFFMIVVVVGVKMFTGLAIPGWATNTIGLLLILVSQSLLVSLMLIFSIMMNRNHLGFLPIRDYGFFISREATVFQRS